MPIDDKITLLNKSLFKKKIIEIYDPIHLQRYWYVNCQSSEEFNEILVKIIPNCANLINFEEDTDEKNDGECIDVVLNGHLVIIFWFNTDSINSISHECLHAVLASAKSRDINILESHDSLCYMLGFLISEMFKKLKLNIKKD